MRPLSIVLAFTMLACSSSEASSTITDGGTNTDSGTDATGTGTGACDPTKACPTGYRCIYAAKSCGGSGACRETPDGMTADGQFVCDCEGRVQIVSPNMSTIPFTRVATGFDDDCDTSDAAADAPAD
jgi:hypothetical protein